MKLFSPILLLAMIFSLLNISCVHYFSRHKKHKKNSMALISPVHNSKAKGWVHFRKMEHGRVLVTAKISGLTPNKKHGFHIHRYGDCRENGRYAGPHLNPYDGEHGSLDSEERHAGDMGNLMADSSGVASYKEVVDICLRKLGGRSIIVHAGEDDLMTQPSGNAGPYIGCGVIGYTMKQKELNLTESAPAGKSSSVKKVVSPAPVPVPAVKPSGVKKAVSPAPVPSKPKSSGVKKAVSPAPVPVPAVKPSGVKKAVSPAPVPSKPKSFGVKKVVSPAPKTKSAIKKVSTPGKRSSSETVPETKKPLEETNN